MSLLSAFIKAFVQLFDPRMRGIALRLLGLSVAVLGLLWVSIAYLLANTALFSIGWIDSAVDIFGGVAVLVLTWMLFPGLVSAAAGLFADRIAAAVEARYYPELPPPDPQALSDSLVMLARYVAITIVLNMFVLVFVFVPPVFPFVFYGVNGYLLGREYFEQVASRRMGRNAILAVRKTHRGPLFIAGVAVAVLLTVPVVNVVAPLLATAAMVHLFERWRTAKNPMVSG
ncbi:MAG: hypothetical protein EXQ86_02735 [Rhodospirillales bacterium]|nr:hypothetical protein [Rhodospirillales bacterium]